MERRDPKTPYAPITIRESSLVEAVIVALEGGEFVQVRGVMWGDGNERCALAVAAEVLARAMLGIDRASWAPLQPAIDAAAAHLGYTDLGTANDQGCTFAEIAQALREVSSDPGS